MLAASGDLVSTEFTVDVINVGGLGGPPSVPVFMTIGEGGPEQVHEVDRPGSGGTASFVVTRDLPLGRHTVSFAIGDSERTIEVDVRASDIVLEPMSHSIAREGSIDLSVMVENQGDLPAEKVSVFAYWKVYETGTDESSTRKQTFAVVDALGAGESQVVTLPVDIPTGSYTFDLEAETESIEVRTDNNAAATIVEVDYVSLVPAVQTTAVSGYELDMTAKAEVEIQVRNTGVAPSGPINVGIVCEDETIEGCTMEFPVDSIAPGASTSIVTQLRLPQGRRPVTVFAGALDNGFRWGDENVQQAEVNVPHLTLEESLALLPWVTDGVSSDITPNVSSAFDPPKEAEESVVEYLSETFRSGRRDLFWAFLGKPWFQDSISRTEYSIVSDLAYSYGNRTALQFLSMPFLDTVEASDLVMVESLDNVRFAGLLPQLMSHPILQEGVTDDQLGTVILLALELLNPQAAETLHTWPWIQDGISMDEQYVMETLRFAVVDSEQVFWEIARKSWVRDGISRAEHNVIWYLSSIGQEYSNSWELEAALAITQMPFLDNVEPIDVQALAALSEFPLRASELDDALNRVLALPVLQNGITDDQAVRVAYLRGVSSMIRRLDDSQAMDVISKILDPDRTGLEERRITLPYSGEVTLTALHTSGGAGQALDGLEHIVRSHEETIGTPLPVDRILMWLGPVPGLPGISGQWTGFLYINRPERADWHAHIAYRVAQFYWNTASAWISGGAGRFMEIISENRRIGTPAEPPSLEGCTSVGNIRQLALSNQGGGCSYNMGAGLFFDLFRNLDEDAFRKGFGDLYLTMDDDSYRFRTDLQCYGPEFSVCYVRNAFVTNADPESAAIAEPIIDRWHYGTDGINE